MNEDEYYQSQLNLLKHIVKNLALIIELLDKKTLKGTSPLTILSNEEAEEEFHVTHTGIDDLSFDADRERRSR